VKTFRRDVTYRKRKKLNSTKKQTQGFFVLFREVI